ncbi:hypothetical protein ACWGI0_32550 [Streptomyces sp. NPDC054802]
MTRTRTTPVSGVYDYVTFGSGRSQAVGGPQDVHVGLRGPVRLARLLFSA